MTAMYDSTVIIFISPIYKLSDVLLSDLFDLLTNLFDLLTNSLTNMSDKLLSSQPKRILELLQVPGIKEELKEDSKKYFNLTALKEWEEAGEPFEEDEEVLC